MLAVNVALQLLLHVKRQKKTKLSVAFNTARWYTVVLITLCFFCIMMCNTTLLLVEVRNINVDCCVHVQLKIGPHPVL